MESCAVCSEKCTHWTRKSVKFASHISTNYHQLALIEMDALKSTMKRPASSIQNLIRHTTKKGRGSLKSSAEAFCFVGNNV